MRSHRLGSSLVLLCCGLALACSSPEPPTPASSPDAATPAPPAASPTASGLPDRDPALAHRLVEQENALLLDVRSPEEFAEEHLPGAQNIPYDQIEARRDEIATLVGPDPNRPIVVYCRSGHRAGIAKETLLGQGYRQITNLGGITDW